MQATNSRKWQLFLKVALIGLMLGHLLAVVRHYSSQWPTESPKLTWQNGRALGGDFVAFYVAGQMWEEDRARLYNYKKQREKQLLVFNEAVIDPGRLPYIYPPLVAAALSFIVNGSFIAAYLNWLIVSAAFLLLTALIFWRMKTPNTIAAIVFFLSAPYLSVECIAAGQTSAIGALIVIGVIASLAKERNALAGGLMSLAYYKPPLFIFFALVALAQKRWSFILSTLIFSTALIAASAIAVSWEGIAQYLQAGLGYGYGNEVIDGQQQSLTKGVSLLSVLLFNLGTTSVFAKLMLLAVAAALIFYIVRIKLHLHKMTLERSFAFFAAFFVISFWLSPWLVIYDLSILSLPLCLIAGAMLKIQQDRRHRVLIASMLILFFSSPYICSGNSFLFFPNFTALSFSLISLGSIYYLHCLSIELNAENQEINHA